MRGREKIDSHFHGNDIWGSGDDIWGNGNDRKEKTGLMNQAPTQREKERKV